MGESIRYRHNPDCLHILKGGELKVIFLNDQNDIIVTLNGAAADCFLFFKEPQTFATVRSEIENKTGIKGSDADFNKLMHFLMSKNLIVEV